MLSYNKNTHIFYKIIEYTIAPKMLGQDCFDLLNNFAQLSLQAPAPRETGLIQTPEMPWNSTQCVLGLQYKNIYMSRMQKLDYRFNIPGVISIAEVIQNNRRYCISGIIKRIQVKRVRAFQKQFTEKYNSSNPLYDILDQLEIEDNSGKLKISMNDTIMGNRKIAVTDLPFGVQVVLQGKFKKHANKFAVRQVYLPPLSPQSSYMHNYINEQGVQLKGKKMLVLSQPNLQQCEHVYNLLSKPYSPQIQSISALVIIGGLQMKIQSINSMASLINRMKNIIDVFIMPSSNLDRRRMFPLQPYNGSFFPESKNQIGLCCNPQQFNVSNGIKIHISCGQNVMDFMKNCSLAKNELDVLQSMIYFSHYCPTAPFSLKTEPYIEDHLVMDEIPHVMIAGKSKEFGSRLVKMEGRQILLVTIPNLGMGLISLNQLQARSFS